MNSTASLLAALQHGDSFFPSGSVSFSWGLETLFTENILCYAENVEMFVQSQLRGRWATFDRGIVAAAYDAATDFDELCRIDGIVETQTLAREMRDGSRRCGLALLRVHDGIATPGAAMYLQRIGASLAHGHQSVMQGFLWAGCGIGKQDVEAVSAHALCVGLLGAALRLGAIGHIDSQRILNVTRYSIEEIMRHDPPPLGRLHAFTPFSEIAVMRHETAESRLFAN
jgi:urease accessory protein